MLPFSFSLFQDKQTTNYKMFLSLKFPKKQGKNSSQIKNTKIQNNKTITKKAQQMQTSPSFIIWAGRWRDDQKAFLFTVFCGVFLGFLIF